MPKKTGMTMDRPLRIAVFVGSFPVLSETFILRQITGLCDLGHEVDIYADTRAEKGSIAQPEIQKYRLLERTTFMDMPPEVAPWEMPILPLTSRTWVPGYDKSIANWLRLARALPKLFRCGLCWPRLTRQLLSQTEYGYQARSLSGLYRLAKLGSVTRRYDVVHAHFGPVGNSFRFTRELWGAPLVVSFHGYDFTTVPRKQGPAIYQKLFAAADLVTANSHYMSQKLQTLGCASEKIHKLPYGIDLQQYRFHSRTVVSGEPVRIVTIGRLVEKKGIEYVIRALQQIVGKGRQFRYDIIGDGPLRPRLEKLVIEHGLNEKVIFHGALTGKAVADLLDQSHLFVLTSVTAQDGDQEGTPVSLLEAQAAGLPVISTKHSGIPEIVLDGQSGFLVSEHNVEELAARLDHLLDNPNLWPILGENGRAYMEKNFSLQECSKALVQIYAESAEKFRHYSGTQPDAE